MTSSRSIERYSPIAVYKTIWLIFMLFIIGYG